MTALPQRQHGTPQAIYDLHARRINGESPRGYLGWSEIGAECDRALWYGWRWVGGRGIGGQLARLFDTGHREEARLLAELRSLGYEVHDRDEHGRQFGVLSHGGHFRGHCDAVVRGLPEAPKSWHLVDVKTIKAKKFDELLKKGLRAMYPKYWAQGQGYMGHLELERAAFIFVCKDDDRIHVERFEFDRAEFEKYEARALRIITAAEPPMRLSDDPAWFACKFCDYHEVCHGGAVPQVNCRTCARATPVMLGDCGAWACEAGKVHIQNPRAEHACHLFIPPLLAGLGQPVDADADSVTYQTADGAQFVNGPAPGFSSAEIRTNPAAVADPTVQHIKATVPTSKVIA